jgi:hypothetical protein
VRTWTRSSSNSCPPTPNCCAWSSTRSSRRTSRARPGARGIVRRGARDRRRRTGAAGSCPLVGSSRRGAATSRNGSCGPSTAGRGSAAPRNCGPRNHRSYDDVAHTSIAHAACARDDESGTTNTHRATGEARRPEPAGLAVSCARRVVRPPAGRPGRRCVRRLSLGRPGGGAAVRSRPSGSHRDGAGPRARRCAPVPCPVRPAGSRSAPRRPA